MLLCPETSRSRMMSWIVVGCVMSSVLLYSECCVKELVLLNVSTR